MPSTPNRELIRYSKMTQKITPARILRRGPKSRTNGILPIKGTKDFRNELCLKNLKDETVRIVTEAEAA
jgi:hypothetical protein